VQPKVTVLRCSCVLPCFNCLGGFAVLAARR
jgi:hypothetical protein